MQVAYPEDVAPVVGLVIECGKNDLRGLYVECPISPRTPISRNLSPNLTIANARSIIYQCVWKFVVRCIEDEKFTKPLETALLKQINKEGPNKPHPFFEDLLRRAKNE